MKRRKNEGRGREKRKGVSTQWRENNRGMEERKNEGGVAVCGGGGGGAGGGEG